MEIKTEHGTYNVPGNGQVNLNTVLGALGTASFLGWGANGNGGSILGGGNNSNYVQKEAFDLSMQLARKDSEIAILQAGKETDAKLVEVYNAAAARDNAYRDRLESQYRDLDNKITAEREARILAEGAQSVFNTQTSTGMATIGNQIANMQNVLSQITTNVIPSNKVCDTGCGCACGN